MAPPFLFSGLSVTITMLLFFVFLNPRPMNVSNWSTSVLSSGMMAASAPEAIALFCARKPASRPITSTKKIRSWEVAVSLILSTHSTMVFNAVSYPMVKSVPYRGHCQWCRAILCTSHHTPPQRYGLPSGNRLHR